MGNERIIKIKCDKITEGAAPCFHLKLMELERFMPQFQSFLAGLTPEIAVNGRRE